MVRVQSWSAICYDTKFLKLLPKNKKIKQKELLFIITLRVEIILTPLVIWDAT